MYEYIKKSYFLNKKIKQNIEWAVFKKYNKRESGFKKYIVAIFRKSCVMISKLLFNKFVYYMVD